MRFSKVEAQPELLEIRTIALLALDLNVYDGNIQNMMNWNRLTGFEWDKGNSRKNEERHSVSQSETEEVFFNQPLLLPTDLRHSQNESRYHALGSTDHCRFLHITFTLRNNGTLIRVISARDMHRKERSIYEQIEKTP